MKRRIPALSALLLLFCFPAMPVAQESQSVILPGPWTARLGGQLIYFFEDGNSNAGTPGGSRGNWRSSLVLTNVHPTAKVKILFQFYTPSLVAVMDFADFVAASQQVTIDPQDIRRPSDNGYLGKVSDGIYVLTATPVNEDYPTNPKAIPFNWLGGGISIRCLVNNSVAVYNAVSRQAVFRDGSSINPSYTSVAGKEGVVFYLDGVNRLFQLFRPGLLSISRLNSPGSLAGGVPFGNRLSFFSFQDVYSNPLYPLLLSASTASVSSFVFDTGESALSLPNRSLSGLKEYTIIPNTVGAAGNFPDFLGIAYASHLSSGGWIRMTVGSLPTGACNLLGWFSQVPNGAEGGGTLLTASSRQSTTLPGSASELK